MDYASCNVVYVDRNAGEDGLVTKEDLKSGSLMKYSHRPEANATKFKDVESNLQTLLEIFSEVHLCTSGKSCMAKVSELNQASIVELIPTLVLIDIPRKDQTNKRQSRDARTPSPNSKQTDGILEAPATIDDYGLELLQWITSEIQYQSLSKLVVPVAVVAPPETPMNAAGERTSLHVDGSHDAQSLVSSFQTKPSSIFALDQARSMRYLDIGAVDVLTSPLLSERLPSLAIHAYRAHRDASKEQRALLEIKRGRKRSWVGVDDQKPYAYLREAMVSGLMDGICKLGGDEDLPAHVRISVAPDRREQVAAAISSWHFSAHDFTDDELLHASLLMLQHALSMPELEHWRISTENLTGFLVASRSAYNAFVPYHNFRHVVDVLQAIFHFLVRLGRLPALPGTKPSDIVPSPVAALIRPFDALTLLITAIGHDVGHPGVNNAFLVTLNAPLAQLYNDRSVLESFHCAAYSQILRRHWPAAFQGGEMRQLMINSILATDMGLHFDYMKRMGFLQEKLHENGGVTDGWNGRLIEEHRTLACSLLIKCADISNVARKYEVAAQWTMILTDEFSRQASMEQELGIPSALFAAPVREIIELGKSQIGFMNMFALPLFQGVTDVMPGMEFCVNELQFNKATWEDKIVQEQARTRQDSDDSVMMDGMFSPRAMSMATPSDVSNQKTGSVTSPLSPDLDLRRALFTKSPFTSNKRINDDLETPFHHSSLPGLSTGQLIPEDIEESTHPSPNESIQDPESRRSSKPCQVQLSYATASAPGLVDHPSQDPEAVMISNGELQSNGIAIQPSLVTEAVLIDSDSAAPQAPRTPEKIESSASEKQRSSNTTESGNSAAGDWASQATSATTSKMPLSPSTQGTSITSAGSNTDEKATPTGTGQHSLVGSPNPSQTSTADSNTFTDNGSVEGRGLRDGKTTDKVKVLKKKPSRFRMNGLRFWGRSKSSSPPTAALGLGPGVRGRPQSEDER